jgi:Tol biopolymer transport system component
MIGQSFSRYRIVAELGQGGMGVVYKAEDLRLGRFVALKFLPEAATRDRQALDRFGLEARAASALNHQNICTIYDIDEHEGRPFIVMELLEGRSLAQRLSSGRLDLETAIDIAMQIAGALATAHAKGIIHRDIKSANIFVTDSGQAKILDFGLAKLVADAESVAEHATATSAPLDAAQRALLTSPGQMMGTVAYMSPEQVRGEELDGRTDIFSFGIVIYEMVTGRLPFQGATSGVVFDGILNKTPAPIAAINPAAPAELAHILDKALEKDRELRYQSARELRADLARLKRDTGSTGATAAMPAGSTATATVPRRRPLLIPMTLAGIAALLAVVGYLWWSTSGRSALATGPSTLSRVTFDEGLQAEPTWSPDGRFIAYSANTSGNFDIWVQPLGGGRAIQVTSDPAVDWQPAWSPDGDTLAFRSERDGGGIFIVPALGGRERKLSAFGYSPAWSPEGSQILVFRTAPLRNMRMVIPHVYLLDPKDGQSRRILEAELAGFDSVRGIVWHPDGRRISFLGTRQNDVGGIVLALPPGAVAGFWTQPIDGGPAIRADERGDVRSGLQQLQSVAAVKWAPGGDAVYVEGTSQRVRSLWKVDVDAATLQWTAGPTRLTTGVGHDTDVSIAADGNRLAFVTRTEVSRLWALPFDANTRLVTGDAVPITPANMSVTGFDLSPSGTVVYIAERPGKSGNELWARIPGAGEPALLTEVLNLFVPRLSRDGTRAAYRASSSNAVSWQLRWRELRGGEERPLPTGVHNVFDWSPDGSRLLTNCPPPTTGSAVCELPITATSATESRPVLIDADYDIWQGRYSPDGRWILFNATSRKEPGVSILGVVAAAGGKWTPLTNATLWADKARWGPDGKTIYFISNRESAFFDVWGVAFDSARGTAIGAEFRVTRHENPSRLVAATTLAELGVNATSLVVPITETSGSIWVLDNIKR